MRDDLRSAFRALRASRAVTCVALAVLALGIGATTAIFSVVEAVVLRALPFPEPDRLVLVGERDARAIAKPGGDPRAVNILSPQNYFDVAADERVFEAIGAVRSGRGTLGTGDGDAEEVGIQEVTSGFFQALRVQSQLGRTSSPDDEVDGRDRVCVISDALWRRRFGGDGGVIGRSLAVNGEARTVIGVLQAGVANPMSLQAPVDVWVPYVPAPAERTRHENSRTWTVFALARLKPGVSVAAAQLDLDRIAAAMTRAYPQWNKNVRVGALPLRDYLVDGKTSTWMLLLFGAVALVLAIACANVANLMLARGSAREREIAVRSALGASRGRVARQLLVESLVLSSLGTIAALGVAALGVDLLRRTMPATVPHVGEIAVDAPVFAAAAVLAVATGVLFGLLPALQASRADVTRALGDQSRAATLGRRRSRFGDGLVVVEVALAMVLVVGAALFIGSFRTVTRIDLGFAPNGLAILTIAPLRTPSAPTETTDAAGRIARAIDALNAVPGVTRAAFVDGGTPVVGLNHSSQRMPNTPAFSQRRITTAYFAAMGIPVVYGRAFSAEDRSDSLPAAILDEAAARAFFPARAAADVIGQSVPLDGGRTVVGIVGNVHEFGPESGVSVTVYVPLAQSPAAAGDFLVKVSGDAASSIPGLRRALQTALPDAITRSTTTMNDGLDRLLGLRRFDMLLVSLLGALGLVIAAVGLYGLLAYLVAQREREIGVRMALGASRESIARLVLGRAGALVGVGLTLGGFGAWALGGTAKAFLFRMNVGDPRVYAAALAALVVAAAAATVIPARRAASVDPLVSLRSE